MMSHKLASYFVLGLSPLVFVGSVQAAPDRLISVSGQCTRSVVPDRASVTVTAEIRDADSKRAMTKATELYERVREKVMKLKLENREVSTSELSLNEQREWENQKMVSKGFVSRIGLRVETSDFQGLGEVSSLASKEGMKEIGGLTTFISREKMREEYNACLKEAVKVAQVRAKELVEPVGARVGEVISISEGGGGMPRPPMPMMRNAMMMADSAAPMEKSVSIEPGKQEIDVTVSVIFGIK